MAKPSTQMMYLLITIVIFHQLPSSAVGQSLLCGGFNKVILDPDGKTSSISMALLNTDDKISSTPCSLKIYVPDVYALSITFAYVVDVYQHIQMQNEKPSSKINRSDLNLVIDDKNKTSPECLLNFYDKKENQSNYSLAWSTSPCANNFSLTFNKLLKPPIQIEWWPSDMHRVKKTLRLVVTAVNEGVKCDTENQIICSKDGDTRDLCISKALACDGINHCPGPEINDESPLLCNDAPFLTISWVSDLLRRIASSHNELFFRNLTSNITDEITPTVPTKVIKKGHRSRDDPLGVLEAALAPYGPWGYFLIGIIICTILMLLFFVYDYFCRKADIIPSDMPPDCIAPAAITGQVYPQRISNIRPPPPYDELEPPPPAYTALFPGDHLKVINEHLEPSTSSAIS